MSELIHELYELYELYGMFGDVTAPQHGATMGG